MTGKENSFLPQQPFSTSLAQSTELSTTLKSDPIHTEETILEASATAQLAQLSPTHAKNWCPEPKTNTKTHFIKGNDTVFMSNGTHSTASNSDALTH